MNTLSLTTPEPLLLQIFFPRTPDKRKSSESTCALAKPSLLVARIGDTSEGFRLIKPDPAIWWWLNREIALKQEKEVETEEAPDPAIDALQEAVEEAIDGKGLEVHIERIRTLVADQKENAIPWLITITQTTESN